MKEMRFALLRQKCQDRKITLKDIQKACRLKTKQETVSTCI
jgi:hypothetical protein